MCEDICCLMYRKGHNMSHKIHKYLLQIPLTSDILNASHLAHFLLTISGSIVFRKNLTVNKSYAYTFTLWSERSKLLKKCLTKATPFITIDAKEVSLFEGRELYHQV